MIGQTIAHYKILEKPRQINGGQVGEVRNSATSVFQRVQENFRISRFMDSAMSGIQKAEPLLFSGSCRRRI